MAQTAKKAKYSPTNKQVDHFHEKIASNIRRHRTASGLSMEAVAREVGTSQHTVYRWEHGMNIPDPKYLLALSRLFKCKPSDFYEGVEGM